MNTQKVARKYTRCGEGNWKADLSDHEVDLIRRLHELDGWGYRKLAAKFEVPRDTIRSICLYRRR